MFILGLIGYTLMLLFSGDVAYWINDINADYFQLDWIGMLANDLKGKGFIATIVWMAPFVFVGAVGTAKTGFSGTSFQE